MIVLDWIYGSFVVKLDATTITGIGGIFGFITSFLSIVVSQANDRKALVRWRKNLWLSMLGLWIGVILIVLDLIEPISVWIFQNLGTKLGVIAWVLGLGLLMRIFLQISRLETISFNKPAVKFSPDFCPRFGFDCLDSTIKQAQAENPGIWIYPLILAADETWRPWRIAERFRNNAITENAGVIWFHFARPPSRNRIERNLIDIDCFSPFTNQGNTKDDLENGILFADPRNPHDLNEKYEKALKKLNEYEKLCVVYDALSDFLYFSDTEIAAQYLRHNMDWEEKNNVRSLYIFRTQTLKPDLEQYILWFSNAVITLMTEEKTKEPVMLTRGLFRDPRSYRIDYDLNRK